MEYKSIPAINYKLIKVKFWVQVHRRVNYEERQDYKNKNCYFVLPNITNIIAI
jgi:hypothetical protein